MPEANVAPAGAVPVGFVTPFAGDLTQPATRQAVVAAGWLPCDGQTYPTSQYPELAAAIGTRHGGFSGVFAVPRLMDGFVRGTSGASGRDPDAGSRRPAAPGGASGDAVGSAQASATAPPAGKAAVSEDPGHTHAYQHLNTDMHEAWNGNTDRMARWSSTVSVQPAGAHSHTITGGDPATVPVSLALGWVIRAKSGPASGACLPGAIGAFGADVGGQPPAGWLYCGGDQEALAGSAAQLGAAIGANYGGDGKTFFALPDVRGRFLRGADHGAKVDPDAAARQASAPGGAVGDAVGSVQGFATGPAQAPFVVSTSGQHAHAQTLVPNNDHHAAWGASGPLAYNCMVWTDDSTETTTGGAHTHAIVGGDKETRPQNLNLDWLIAQDSLGDAPPIGAIMAYGGDAASPATKAALHAAGWHLCIGEAIPVDQPLNQALYAIIGDLFGKTDAGFLLPDLRGCFVIGAGGAHKTGDAIKQSTTGAPATPFTTDTAPDHTHEVTGIPTDTHVIDVVAGVDLAANNTDPTQSTAAGDHTHQLAGWDAESRPVNLYVDYIIRFR
jgi:microcystin-dependent protein